MTGRDMRWRLFGFALIGFAGGISLIHRMVLETNAQAPASGLEGALALTSFILACVGATFVIQGARLRDDWKRDDRVDVRLANRRQRPGMSASSSRAGRTKRPRP
jgi:hypothetical protein